MASSPGTPVGTAITIVAAEAVAHAMGETPYAVVGGAACSLLGSSRLTSDVDFVVPNGKTKDARTLLQNQPTYFHVNARTRHTQYKSSPPVDIEILAPPAVFKGEFDSSTPCVDVNGVKVLKPTLLLEAKCCFVFERTSNEKRRTDLQDIEFLLSWCAQNRTLPTRAEVPSANNELFSHMLETIPDSEKSWTDAGWDSRNGMFTNNLFGPEASAYKICQHADQHDLTKITIEL